ncbi:MAG TPA: carboxypeptidase-like regulatory domain-containing protein [Solirubrobacteraceae bacterium]|nr:carboxypeptidase-like regulatory domain-containing protein [Solirubrobacteraceae bacterium]
MSDVQQSPRRGEDALRARRARARRVGLGLLAPALTALALVGTPAAAQAATTGTITGSFTVPAGTASAADVNVLLADRNGDPVAIGAGNETVTGAGSYTVSGIAPGQYYVYFNDTTASDNVAPDYYGDAGTDNINKATVVTVPATGGSQALGAEALGAGAVITGTVSDANAASETGSHVTAEPLSTFTADPLLGGTRAAVASGAYTIRGLPAGSYTLSYGATGTNFALSGTDVAGSGLTYDLGSATQYAVTAGTVTSASFAVPAVGAISGVVTDSSAAPLAGVNVADYDSIGKQLSADAATTAVDGTYTITDLLPGTYEIGFSGLAGSGLAPTYFGGSELSTAAKVTVTSGVTTPSVNGTLAAGATVSGTVTAAQGGALLGGLDVRLVDGQNRLVDETTTNANGTYTLTNVPAGTWYAEFVGGRAYNGSYYQTEYYLGESTLGGSLPLKLASGQTLAGVNEALMPESTTLPGVPKVSAGKLSGLSKNKVALSFRLTAGTGPAGYLLGFSVKLPKNVSWNKSALKKDIVIAHDKYTEAIKAGRLVITFTTGKKVVNFRIKAGGIRVTKKIETQAKKRKIASEGIALVVSDTTGRLSAGSFTVKKPH